MYNKRATRFRFLPQILDSYNMHLSNVRVQEGPWKQLHYQDHEPYVSVDADAPLRVFP